MCVFHANQLPRPCPRALETWNVSWLHRVNPPSRGRSSPRLSFFQSQHKIDNNDRLRARQNAKLPAGDRLVYDVRAGLPRVRPAAPSSPAAAAPGRWATLAPGPAARGRERLASQDAPRRGDAAGGDTTAARDHGRREPPPPGRTAQPDPQRL